MKKIGVWGDFGRPNVSNGQSIKIRSVFNVLRKKIGDEDVCFVDTNQRTNKIKILIKTCRMFSESKIVIFIPASNGLKKISAIVPIINFFYKRRIIIIPVGSNLPNVAKENQRVLRFLKKADKIFCQGLKQKLDFNDLNLFNVETMNNFREQEIIIRKENANKLDRQIKVCTFSRVAKDKGIFDAISAIQLANKERKKFNLDIYGPIDKDIEMLFFNIIEKDENIHYKGVAKYTDASKIISEYECLLFPTYYHGEGQAGTLVDSLFAGTPVIATDWKYNNELITDGVNGYLVNINHPEEIKDKLILLFSDKKKHAEMVSSSQIKASEFTADFASKVLIDSINRMIAEDCKGALK